jgi:predicted peptidase
VSTAQPPAVTVKPDNQTAASFARQVPTTFTGNYLVALPEGYAADITQKWPLIVYLHGANGRGNDVKRLKEQGLPFVVEQGQKFPWVLGS